MFVGQVGFHRTIPLVLDGTGGIGQTNRIKCVCGTGRIPQDSGTGRTNRIECVLVGQVGFHRTVPLVLHGTGGIGRTNRIECVSGTGRIPQDCPF